MQNINLAQVCGVDMKIPNAARRLAATEQERRGWISHLKRMDDEYRAMLAYAALITISERQIRSRKHREL